MGVPEHLGRWKRHLLVNGAVLLSGSAMLLLSLAIMGNLLPPQRTSDRGNPLYWALLVPAAVWIHATMNFRGWAARAFVAVSALASIGAVGFAICLLLLSDADKWGSAELVLSLFAALCGVAATALACLPKFREFVVDATR